MQERFPTVWSPCPVHTATSCAMKVHRKRDGACCQFSIYTAKSSEETRREGKIVAETSIQHRGRGKPKPVLALLPVGRQDTLLYAN